MEKGISTDDISYFIDKMKLTNTRLEFNTDIYQLIEGDIEKTMPIYLEQNPGFRISYLDIDKPTYESLKMLYDRIVRGGIMVFDEYACEKWTESNAVDRFLKEHPDLNIKTLLWGRTPTAYIIKN
jgi:dTDP-rhamnose C3-O-methyltransferase